MTTNNVLLLSKRINERLTLITKEVSKEAKKVFFRDLFTESDLFNQEYISSVDYGCKVGKEIKKILNTYESVLSDCMGMIYQLRIYRKKIKNTAYIMGTPYFFRKFYIKNKNLFKGFKEYKEIGETFICFSNGLSISPTNKLEEKQLEIIRKYNNL